MFEYNKYAIGEALRKLRKEHELTQIQMAEKLEVSAIHYSLIEQGQRKFSIDVLFKIMEVFSVNADRVLAVNVEKKEKEDIFSEKLSSLSADEQEYVINAWMVLLDGVLSRSGRMVG